MMKLICGAGLLALSLAATAAEEQTVYRWIDADGRVHYGQIPPQGQRYEEVSPRGTRKAAAAGQPTAGTGLSGNVDAFLKQAETERTAREKAENDAREQRQLARKNCDLAREREQFMVERGAHRLATKNEDGTVARMDDADYQQRLSDIRGKVQEYCQ